MELLNTGFPQKQYFVSMLQFLPHSLNLWKIIIINLHFCKDFHLNN